MGVYTILKEEQMPILLILGILILLIIFGVIRFVQGIIDSLSSSRRTRSSGQRLDSRSRRSQNHGQIRIIAGKTYNQYGEIVGRQRFNRFGEIEDQQGRR
jgi:hypothetical protein